MFVESSAASIALAIHPYSMVSFKGSLKNLITKMKAGHVRQFDPMFLLKQGFLGSLALGKKGEKKSLTILCNIFQFLSEWDWTACLKSAQPFFFLNMIFRV